MINNNNSIQVFWASVGSLFSFSFSIVSSIILSRYFLKEDYGTYKQVLYVYNTLLIIFTLGLPKSFSFFLPRVEVVQAKHLIKKITNIFFVLGAVFSILLFVFSHSIATFLNNPNLEMALRIFSPVPLLMLPTMGLEGILATYKKTKFISLYTVVTRSVMLLCVVLPIIFLNGTYITAIIGFVIASFIDFILAYYLKFMPIRSKVSKKCNVSYKEIFNFSLPLLYASIWGMIIASADQFFISRYYGSEVFADFSNGSIDLPFIGMITAACATVLSPIFSKMSYENIDFAKEVFPIWRNVFEKTAKLIYPILIFSWVFADIIMIALYGKLYEVSYIYFRIKIIANFFTLIIYAPLLINTGHVRLYSNVHMIIAFFVVLLEFLSVKIIGSPYAISIISLVCQLIKILVLMMVVGKILNVSIIQLIPFKTITKIFLPSIVFLSLTKEFILSYLNVNEWYILIIGFCLYLFFFIPFSFLLKLNYLSIIKPFLNRV